MTSKLRKPSDLQCNLDKWLQGLLSCSRILGGIIAVLFDIKSYRGSLGSRTRQTYHKAGTILEHDTNALVTGNAAINRVFVLKVVHIRHCKSIESFTLDLSAT